MFILMGKTEKAPQGAQMTAAFPAVEGFLQVR